MAPPRLTKDLTDPADALDRLRRHLAGLDRVVVAFSGGADSALAGLRRPRRPRGRSLPRRHRGVAVVGRLPSTTTAAALAAEWGLRWREVADRRDGRRRLPWPTTATAASTARPPSWTRSGRSLPPSGATVVLGVNLDDLGDHRPGQQAAAERGRGVPAGRGRASPRPWCARPRRAPRPAHLGQAGGRVPGLAGALRHRRSRSTCSAGSSGPRRRCAALGFVELRVRHYDDTGPPRGARRRPGRRRRPARRGRRRGAAAPATATSPSTSRACARATSTRRWPTDRAHQPQEPGPPLNGPTTFEVTQPP